jgi:hypothetical protein
VKRLGFGLFVSHHPALTVTSASFEGREVLCLGHIVDPKSPPHGNEEILQNLVVCSRTFEDLEKAAAELAGRWILFVSLNGQTRMYPDAVATKQAFYFTGTVNGELWIASQPGLLSRVLGLKKDPTILRQFHSHQFKSCWPGEATPYRNVRQLQPNHYLELQSGQAVRFWPCRDLKPCGLEEAARTIRDTLSAILLSLSLRRRLAMTLTAGYDSRVLFACSEKIRENMTFFSVSRPDSQYHDIAIPRRLMRQFGVKGEVLRAKKIDDRFYSVYRKNVDEMLWESGNIMINTCGRYGSDDWFVVTGNFAEIGRTWYYRRDGLAPTHINPETVSKLTGFEGNPIAIREFEKWLSEVPRDFNINILDLLLWEFRFYNWVSLALTGYDTVCEVIAPWNCRKVLETALKVGVEMRKEPFRLFRRIFELSDPELLKIPFNDSLRTRIRRAIEGQVHAGITRRFWEMRMQLAGFGRSSDQIPTSDNLLEKQREDHE